MPEGHNEDLTRTATEMLRGGASLPRTSLKVLYFFAGKIRKGDIRSFLQAAAIEQGWSFLMDEIDLLRGGAMHDLSSMRAQNHWIDRIHEYDIIICTPPCASHSRVSWANRNGPHPVRSAAYPDGFPWLSAVDRTKCNLYSSLVSFMWGVFRRVQDLQFEQDIIAFGEHPEDLGRVRNGAIGEVPASIWRMSDFDDLRALGWWSGAFRQCDYNAPTPKPTRCISNSSAFGSMAAQSVPEFDESLFYSGPIMPCGHVHTQTLLRRAGESGPFRTEASAAYPPDMCSAIARCLLDGLASFVRPVPTVWVISEIPAPTSGTVTPPAAILDQEMALTSFDHSDEELPSLEDVEDLISKASAFVEAPEAVVAPDKKKFKKWNKLENSHRQVHLRTSDDLLVDPPPDPSASRIVPPLPPLQTAETPSPVVEKAPAVLPKWFLTEGVDFIKAGWWGKGDAISTQKVPGKDGRPLQDGGGLCSPGRWPMARRVLPQAAASLTALMDTWLDQKAADIGVDQLEKLCFKIMAGKFTSDPFGEELEGVRASLVSMLADAGMTRPPGQWRKGQCIDYGLLHMLGEWLGDPDYQCMAEFCQGVRIGVGVDLPRTPAVWPSKAKWPLGEFDEEPVSELNSNYPSAKLHRQALLAELKQQEEWGWMVPMTLGEAQARFGVVSVAPLAVIEEKAGKTRTLHDASNSVRINHRIKVQDGEQCPSALDVQAAFTADEGLSGPVLSLVVDIEKAHRRVPVAECDWGHLGCSATDLPPSVEDQALWPIYLNTVGTYGVASASWHWARISSLFQRIAYYSCGLAYLFRYADDFMALATNRGGVRFSRPLLRFIVLCNLVGMPLKWEKTRGGVECEFVGYIFFYDKLLGGISEKRTAWLCQWARKAADDGMVVTRDGKAALGRFAFSAALLRFLLPFLGPLYAWFSVLEDGAAWPLPEALIIILRWVANQLEKRHMVPLRLKCPKKLGRYFKADARADGQEVHVGGFEMRAGFTLWQCRWFSFSLNPTNAPWAFFKQNEAYRTIASLELFASLLCVMLFVAFEECDCETFLLMTGVTDNKGNEALINKNMSSKYPLYIILLELTEQLHARNLILDLRWQRREQNQAADDLTNGLFSQFDVSKRINPSLSSMPWLVLPKLMVEAGDLHRIIEQKKKDRVSSNEGLAMPRPTFLPKKRKLKKTGLRVTDPW